MILVDSSVWIDYFNGRDTTQTNTLDVLLGQRPILIGDLILAEVLQGFRDEKDYRTAWQLFDTLEIRNLVGREVALQAAQNYRILRSKGITPRKTIDIIIGTYCIMHALALLHADRDFDVMQQQFGLAVFERPNI